MSGELSRDGVLTLTALVEEAVVPSCGSGPEGVVPLCRGHRACVRDRC